MDKFIEVKKGDITALTELEDGYYKLTDAEIDTRTIKQNSALHKYFTILATELNNAGFSVEKILKVDTVWTMESVKELLWKPIQESRTNKKSTTKLNKDEISKVYDILNIALSEKLGLFVDFPNKEGIK